MAGRVLPSQYSLAAQEFYDAGRASRRAGRGGNGPNQANDSTYPFTDYWDQSWRSNAALIADLRRQPGYETVTAADSIFEHYLWGWWDEFSRWPDRGYAYSMGDGYKLPPIRGNKATREYEWRYYYTAGWLGAAEGRPYGLRDLGELKPFPARVFSTDAQAFFEFNEGYNNQRTNTPPPAVGYVEPPSVPAQGSGPTPTAGTPPSDPFLSIFVPYLILRKARRLLDEPQGETTPRKKGRTLSFFR